LSLFINVDSLTDCLLFRQLFFFPMLMKCTEGEGRGTRCLMLLEGVNKAPAGAL
jgi:hypothetical protein